MAAQHETAGVLRKVKREGITKVKAESLKPPEPPSAENGNKHHLVYVANGREYMQPCTPEVFRKVDGPPVPPGVDKLGKGLDFKLHSTFYVIKDLAKGGLIVALDQQPENVTAKGAVSEEAKLRKDIVIKIAPKTGWLEVKQYPPGVSDKTLLGILNELDVKDTVSVGDVLGVIYEVTEVAGTTIHITKLDAGE